MPENQEAAVDQLKLYNELGVSIIEVQSPLPQPIWNEINRLEFEVYGNLGIKFPTASTFVDHDSTLIRSIETRGSAYLSQPSVSAVGLFEYGAIHRPAFRKRVQSIAKQLRSHRAVDLYFKGRRTVDNNVFSDFILWEVSVTPANINTLSVPQESQIGGYIFAPSKELAGYLTPFKHFLEQTSPASSKPIFVHQDWLDSTLEKHPNFAEILQSITSRDETVFPLPDETIPDPSSSVLPILLLLIIWGSVAWHFHSSPLYRKSLFRYFTAHKFFINDIYQRHIRSPFPALLIILQNSVFLAACIFAMSISLLNSLGEEAILYHFPQLNIFGNNLISIFIWSVLLTLLISIICILWLYLVHKRMNSITQIATIYTWPQHINFLLGTVVITLFSSGASSALIYGLTMLVVITFILSFFFASLDTARFAKSTFMYQLKTSGLYFLIWGSFITWILINNQWMEIINLSINLR